MHISKKTLACTASLILALGGLGACAQTSSPRVLTPLEDRRQTETLYDRWEPDEIVDPDEVTEVFFASPIPDKVFDRMMGKSYKEDCEIPREELSYLRLMHHDGQGNVRIGEMVCNVEVEDDLVEIFRNLYHEGYPIERMVLIDEYDADDRASMDANNTSCFNYRKIAGTNKMSKHAQGIAVDINPLYNPWVKVKTNGTLAVSPEKGRPYANRNRKARYPLINRQDESWRQFTDHGFIWGGDWTSIKDYQHFEKK